MKNKKSLLFFVAILFSITFEVNARSGCCSWHDGVCGCRCCDGTPLSSKCAPYYPSCNSNYSEPVVVKSCPANSVGNYPNCNCNFGYAKNSKGNCSKIPSNSHPANNGKDLWLCDVGYKEVGNSCVKDVEKSNLETNKNTQLDIKKDDAESSYSNTSTKNIVDTKPSKQTSSDSDDGSLLGGLATIFGGAWIYKKLKK